MYNIRVENNRNIFEISFYLLNEEIQEKMEQYNSKYLC